jgi:hypothetical protein
MSYTYTGTTTSSLDARVEFMAPVLSWGVRGRIFRCEVCGGRPPSRLSPSQQGRHRVWAAQEVQGAGVCAEER